MWKSKRGFERGTQNTTSFLIGNEHHGQNFITNPKFEVSGMIYNNLVLHFT